VHLFFCPVGATEFSPGPKADHSHLVPILGIFVGPNKELGADTITLLVLACYRCGLCYQSLKYFLWPLPGEWTLGQAISQYRGCKVATVCSS